MSDRDVFRRNLSRYISESGMMQKEIADKLNVDKSTVSAWVTGRGYPRADIMEKLAILFGVRLSDLVCEQQPEESEEAHLLSMFHSMNSLGKSKLLERAEELTILYGKKYNSSEEGAV